MAGRPINVYASLKVKELRNNKKLSYRKIVTWFKEHGIKTELKQVQRWYKYDIGKIVDKVA